MYIYAINGHNDKYRMMVCTVHFDGGGGGGAPNFVCSMFAYML